MKGLTGYAAMMLKNPENPKIGGIGVQTIFTFDSIGRYAASCRPRNSRLFFHSEW
jgi:hypothetical protein